MAALAPSMVPSPNKKHDRRMLREEIQEIFDGSIRNCFPELVDVVFWCSRLEGTRQQKLGDYLCEDVLTICQGLRDIRPDLFSLKRPLDIAQELIQDVKNNPKSVKMLDNLHTHDVGYITFNLSSEWMVKRIKKMLAEGIDTWAPVNLDRAVVSYPTLAIGADLHADVIRSRYIRQMLSQMLAYSGVAVGQRDYSRQSDRAVNSCFFGDRGVIKSKSSITPLFAVKEEAIRTIPGRILTRIPLNNVFADLGTLWQAINVQRGELILFVTPVRQREHVEQCIAAAKTVKWLPGQWSPTVLCMGYRTSNTEREKLEAVWNEFESHPKAAYLVRLGKYAGYSAEESFECAVKYTYLKTHRLAECTFNIDEMLDAEGDTFVYLLKTQAIIPSHLENIARRGMVNYTEAFFERERGLELHLVQFTEVIDEACLTFNLHLVCEYVKNLCKKFTSYFHEVLRRLDLKTYMSKLFLYDTFRVVMQKCFHLLGISPELSGTHSRVMLSTLKQVQETPFENYFFPLPVSDARRPEHLNSRFEMFGMNVTVYHPDFEVGNVFGNVSLIDKGGSLFDQRLALDKNDNGHVSYFYHEADEAIGIRRNSDLFFGNPSPPCSVPFWLDVEINALLVAITAEKDKCFQLLNCQERIPLSKFWADKLKFERGTLRLGSKDGCIDIDYILLRDALDTSMKLEFESPKDPNEITYVTGSIFAYYGNGVLDGCDESSKDRYKAVLFHADVGFKLKVGQQKLKKSVMAVPADGCLMIEAVIFDVKAGKYVSNGPQELRPGPNNHSEWRMSWENGCFSLRVEWTKGPKCLYA